MQQLFLRDRGLLDSCESLYDFRNGFSVLVGTRDDAVYGVFIDAGGLAGYVVYFAIGMPDGAREGKGHARLELCAWGTRNCHDKTASFVELANACPLSGFGVVAPD